MCRGILGDRGRIITTVFFQQQQQNFINEHVGVGRGKRGEQGLRLSPSPCRIGDDVWSSTGHTVMQRNVTDA